MACITCCRRIHVQEVNQLQLTSGRIQRVALHTTRNQLSSYLRRSGSIANGLRSPVTAHYTNVNQSCVYSLTAGSHTFPTSQSHSLSQSQRYTHTVSGNRRHTAGITTRVCPTTPHSHRPLYRRIHSGSAVTTTHRKTLAQLNNILSHNTNPLPLRRYCTVVERDSDAQNATDASKWVTVIGLELHAQIRASTKLFSGAPVGFASPPNSDVALFDCSMPGALPVLNQRCVDAAVATGLALGCTPNLTSRFDRKHYFYFDQPSGYQITQLHHPIVGEGAIVLKGSPTTAATPDTPVTTTVRLERIQLETDTGKSVHTDSSVLIDLNRAGCGLMEIVTYPDIRSGADASLFVRQLQSILREIGTCDGNMAEGSLRVDANVSVHRRPHSSQTGDAESGTDFGTRVEIKNVNGTRHLRKAIEYEAQRQIEIIESGARVLQETRMYSPKENVTLPMRSKEIAKDYRFMPEPDVPSLVLTPAYVESIRSSLPTLSTDLASYMSAKYGLNPSHGEIISADAEVLECYESLVRQGSRRDSSAVGKWMCSEILSALNNKKTSFDKLASPYDSLSALYDLVQQNTISTQVSRKVFALICDGDIRTPQQIIKANDWATVSDVSAIRDLCAGVIAKNQDIVTVYKLGKQHVFKALIGKAMKEARGKADAKVVTAQLQSLLDAENK